MYVCLICDGAKYGKIDELDVKAVVVYVIQGIGRESTSGDDHSFFNTGSDHSRVKFLYYRTSYGISRMMFTFNEGYGSIRCSEDDVFSTVPSSRGGFCATIACFGEYFCTKVFKGETVIVFQKDGFEVV